MVMAFDMDVRKENTDVRWVGFLPPYKRGHLLINLKGEAIKCVNIIYM